MHDIIKYPRTRHIEGSRLQPGDEDLSQVPFRDLRGKHLVVEEKVDGANCGISFTSTGRMLIQSRGHFLTGGSAFEDQFNMVKAWANTYQAVLWSILGDRYIMYGENVYKRHTVFYDALPHYFMEFDVFDKKDECFLSTELRRIMFDGTPVVSVPVLHEGPVSSLEDLLGFIRPSLCKTPAWRERYEAVVSSLGLDLAKAWERCDPSDLAEGLYVKWEEDGRIVRWEATENGKPVTLEGRYKWVRADFHQKILEVNEGSRGHVAFQPTIPNQLAEGIDIFSWAG